MNILEKSLEEIIDELKEEGIIIDDEKGNRVVEIIRSHMDDAKDTNVPTDDGWIPVGERLPEERTDCLVTVKYDGFMGMYGVWIKTGHLESDNDWWGDCMGGEVIAWKPLMNPYKPKHLQEDSKHD